MFNFEIISQAIKALFANKLRSSLTLLALIIGVFSVLVSTTAVAVLDNYFTETLSIMGSDVVTVQKNPAIQLTGDNNKRNRKRITFEQAEQLEEQIVYAKGMSPLEGFSMTKIQYASRETEPNVVVRGSNEFYIENNAYEIESGRNLSAEDVQYARSFVVIGKDIQTELFPNLDPLGKEIRIDGRNYLIVGVLAAKGSIFGSSFDNFVLIPYTTGISFYGGYRDIGIQVRAPEISGIQRAIDELTGVLRVIRAVAPGQENDFEIVTNDSLSSSFDSFTSVLYIGGAFIGLITLLGAGIGVMNIMLVSVTERTKEIGVRKAVGATKNAIVTQFLAEAVFICQIGGVLGMIFGIAAGNALAYVINASVVIPIWSVLGSFLGMLLIGVVFGVYPAFKAAQLDPIESLRYE
ncbi:MAG: FtsX-like permease family protein [Bacteroidetes bacterium]|nr:FtsX-like permease family protein [Bacteroidota bacterium]